MKLPRIIAELGQTANDSHDTAIRLLNDCARAGAWAIKVQWLTPETIATADAAPYWHTTRYADTQRESFTLAGIRPPGWYYPIRVEARKLGVKFIASVFNIDAVTQAVELDIDAIKIASGDITTWELLHAAADTGKPIILSTGASEPAEIVDAVETINQTDHHGPVTLLACPLIYPTPETKAHLGRITALHRLAHWAVDVDTIGYSDHTEGVWAAALAAAAGAEVIEKHVRPEHAPTAEIPDLDMAITPDQFADYVTGACQGAIARGVAVLAVDSAERPARNGARRAWYATRPLPAGHRLVPGDLVPLRPWADNHTKPDHDYTGGVIVAPVDKGAPILAANYKRIN